MSEKRRGLADRLAHVGCGLLLAGLTIVTVILYGELTWLVYGAVRVILSGGEGWGFGVFFVGVYCVLTGAMFLFLSEGLKNGAVS